MASSLLVETNMPKAPRAAPCAAAGKDTHLKDQEVITNMQTRASQSTGTGLASDTSRNLEPQGSVETLSKRSIGAQGAGSSSDLSHLVEPQSDHPQKDLQFQTAAQWLGQEAKDARESKELRLKTHRVRAYQGESTQKRNLDQTLTQEMLMDFSAPQRPRYDPYELDCPLFRLYAEEPHLFTGIDYFED